MRRVAFAALAFVFSLMASGWAAAGVQVCFSPPLQEGCDPTQTIVRTINSAQHQVLVQAYSFTSTPIAKAVVEAKRRSLDVRVILDKSNLRQGYSVATLLEHAGVPVLIDAAHAIAHNKEMIVDGQTVVTGSFNFTKAAEEHNAENLVVIRDPAVAAVYVQNWNFHAAHSKTMLAASENPSGSAVGRKADEDTVVSGPIVGNRRSHIYAWPGCESYDTMAPRNRAVFPTVQAAEAAGYRQARNCR